MGIDGNISDNSERIESLSNKYSVQKVTNPPPPPPPHHTPAPQQWL